MSDKETVGTGDAPSASSALFDLRTVIAILFLVYGVVLTVMGFVSDSPAELAKAGGIDINLWSGIVMIVIGAAFVAWARRSRWTRVGGDTRPGASAREARVEREEGPVVDAAQGAAETVGHGVIGPS